MPAAPSEASAAVGWAETVEGWAVMAETEVMEAMEATLVDVVAVQADSGKKAEATAVGSVAEQAVDLAAVGLVAAGSAVGLVAGLAAGLVVGLAVDRGTVMMAAAPVVWAAG